MKVVEYIEQQHQLAHSDEVQNYINNLKDFEGYIMPCTYKNLAILKGCGKCMVFTGVGYNWVELNSFFAIIYTSHFFSKYRKRVPFIPNLNIRCNKEDRLLGVIQTLWNINLHLVIVGDEIDGFLTTRKQPFYLCEDGLIPVTFLSPTVIRCNTFISLDLFTKEQQQFWNNVYKDFAKWNIK